MTFDLTWIGRADTPEGNWLHPSTLNPPNGKAVATPFETLPTTLLDGEVPHFWASPEAWKHYADIADLQGIPYLGRDLGDQNIAQILRHPWAVGTPGWPRRAVAVPFYAGAEASDRWWIGGHKRLQAARQFLAAGLTVYGVLRAVRSGNHPGAGDRVPIDTLTRHAAELRVYGLSVALWEGDPEHFKAARAAAHEMGGGA